MKHHLPLLFSLLFILSLHSSISAQIDTTQKEVFKHHLGIATGETIGFGLSYRYWPKRFGIQTTFAPYKSDSRTEFNTGLTFLFQLVESGAANFFLYQSNQYYYEKRNFDSSISNPNGFHVVNDYFNNGLGFGIEFVIVKRVGLNVMFGYGAYDNFERIGLAGEGGLYYKI